MRIKMLLISLILLVISKVLYSQDTNDSCNCEVQRILSTYKRLEKNYIEKSKERLLLSINEDPILKNNFLMGDSANYKKLQLHINPIMKFGIETKFYTGYENIWKYLVFDTINYSLNENTYRYLISMGYGDNWVGKKND